MVKSSERERECESERESKKHVCVCVCVLLHFISALHSSVSADFFSHISSSSSKNL